MGEKYEKQVAQSTVLCYTRNYTLKYFQKLAMNTHFEKMTKSFENYYEILKVITINCLVLSRPNHF